MEPERRPFLVNSFAGAGYSRQEIADLVCRLHQQDQHQSAKLIQQLYQSVAEQQLEIADLDARLALSKQENDSLHAKLESACYTIKRMLQARSKVDLCYFCAKRGTPCLGNCKTLAKWKGAD